MIEPAFVEYVASAYLVARAFTRKYDWAVAIDAAFLAFAGWALATAASPGAALLLLPYALGLFLVPRGALRNYAGFASAMAAVGAVLMAEPQPYLKALGYLLATTAPGALIAAGLDPGSLEGLFRYLIVSSASVSFIIVGLSAGGELGSLLIFAGILIELGAFPAYIWVPDVYGRSAPEGLVLVSSLTKLASALALLLIPASPPYWAALAVGAASMLIGNLGALTPADFRRVLAYAAVVQAGFAAFAYPITPALSAFLIFADAVGIAGLFSHLSSPGPKWSAWALALNNVGAPPLLGFWPKLVLLVEASKAYGPAWTIYLLAMIAAMIPYYARLASSAGSGGGARPPIAAVAAVVVGALAPLWFINVLSLL
ncbi:MAG: proton-conducting transporter membrane subunit [Thermoproteus sp. AZ2]|jgi:NADH-quinone oxidoreductase subunit N|uniref:Proton-conducting transporter membrane subunit n=1 Tax=Thermoproteus sp. AZ2 TaxID=1609232 RepID=A0ACC6V1Z0_9CREN